jgi:uncharacterized protein
MRAFLLLHGYEGNAPEHWQGWLSRELAAGGETVRYPDLPEPLQPRIDDWLAVLRDELAALGDSDVTVLGHSLGAALWLHHAARGGREADRVLLVAPPGPSWANTDVHGFMPIACTAVASDEALLVCSADDPYCTVAEAHRYARDLAVPLELIQGGGHLATADGYGPWPWVRDWSLRR